MTSYKTIDQLPVNRTIVFKTLLQGDDRYVRTGTIGDGSCAFHSIMHAFSPRYVGANESARQKIVDKVRNEIASSITQPQWLAQQGVAAIISFQQKISKNLSLINAFLSDDETSLPDKLKIECGLTTPANISLFQIVFDIISPQTLLDDTIIPKLSEYDTLSECKDIINTVACDALNNDKDVKQVSSTRQRFLKNRLSLLIEGLTRVSESEAFDDYISSMRDSRTYVDTTMFDNIADWFGRDIYVIDGKTRLPYSFTTTLKNRTAIVLLWVNENHYEVIGRVCDGNTVKREFEQDDILVKKMNMFIYEPLKLNCEYPELYPYINN